MEPTADVRHSDPSIAVIDKVTHRTARQQGLLQVRYEDVNRYGCNFDWQADKHLLGREGLGEHVAQRIELGKSMTAENVEQAEAGRRTWQDELARTFERVQAIALPTMPTFPIPIDRDQELDLTTGTGPVNLAGNPALALPVPTGQRLPTSLQLVGPHNSEDALLALGRVVESAVR